MSQSRPTPEDCRALGRQCLTFAVRSLNRPLTSVYDAALAPSGLRSTQFTLLCVLRAMGPRSVGSLAEVLATDASTLSRNVRVLADQGWVGLSPGKDQRERVVNLTDDGLDRLAAALPLWQEVQAQLEATLFVDDRTYRAFVETLHRVRRRLVSHHHGGTEHRPVVPPPPEGVDHE